MPLEDEIIPDEKSGTNNQGDVVHNFLDSAQTILAEAVAKSAAEKVVDGMFSPGHNSNQGGPPQQEGLYPDLNREENRNKEPSFMDTAQNAFADAFAKRASEKVVDSILPSNNNRQPITNNGPPNQEQPGFDLGSLGSSLLESLAGQVLHPSENQGNQHQNVHQHAQGREKDQQGFDLGNELMGLAGQLLHSQNQKQQIDSKAHEPQRETDSQSGFDFNKVSTELLSSLAQQVLHPDKKDAEHQNPQVQRHQDGNQSGLDFGKVGAELLESLAQQVLHPSDKKENASVQQQASSDYQRSPSSQQGGGDIGSILGSLAENVLGGAKHNQEGQVQGQGPPVRQSTLAESAGDIASSVLSSLAESMLHKNPNEQQQYQGPPPQWHGPGPQGYGPGPHGYGPGPQGFGSGPQGFGPGPQGYGPGPQGYGPGPQGYGPQNYSNHQGGVPANPREGPLTDDIWTFSPHDREKNRRAQQEENDDSTAAELGSFLVKSLASKVLEPRQ